MKLAVKFLAVVSFILLALFLWLQPTNTMRILWNIGQEIIMEKKQKESKEAIVHITRQDGTIVKLPMETYLEGVVGSEMPASFEMEALKAQCVAARTFVTQRNYQVDDTIATQVYHDDKQMHKIWGKQYDTMHKRITTALKETKGEILTYKGKPISAVFFSSSCGKTANSEQYWTAKTPYLRSVDSSWDKKAPGYEKSVTVSARDLATLLGFQQPVKEVGKPSYYASGYVKSITIDRITFSGRQFRDKLDLRSSCFTIQKQKQGYVITTKGFGHGLGMSQYGAQFMAQNKKTYQEILMHYYTGVKIEKK